MIESTIPPPTSLLGFGPISRSFHCHGASNNEKAVDVGRSLFAEFMCKKVSCSPSFSSLRVKGLYRGLINSQATELTREPYAYRGKDEKPRDLRYGIVNPVKNNKPTLWLPKNNKANKPSLNNPLLRQEMLGCGWLTAIFEWDGVLIEDKPDLEKDAWLVLSEEEGRASPPGFILKRIEGMKNEQAIAEVLCWSRDPSVVKRIACRKEEIHQSLHGGVYRLRPGSQEFIDVLVQYKIPMALVSTRPRKYLEDAVHAIGIEGIFNVIIAAEDVHRGKPDPEMFTYAAQLLQFVPKRCIVFGNSNQTVEAAHDGRMKCVAVASKHPVYELRAADRVVKHLDELSMVDLKKLVGTESSDEPELEVE